MTRAQTVPDALPAGYKLGSYEIQDVLGAGGFGITYRARDVNLDEHVAIKEYLRRDVCARRGVDEVTATTEENREKLASGLRRFYFEGRTLARCKHPAIVRVRTMLPGKGTAYMVMDYESGGSLQELLDKGVNLKENALLGMIHPLLDGLRMMHGNWIFHRDIKPANIFIREDYTPLLIDFGAAREIRPTDPGTITASFSTGYSPHEQYFGWNGNQGPWTDIYALGATLYRAVTGEPPMDAVHRRDGISSGDSDLMMEILNHTEGRYSRTFLDAVGHALGVWEHERPASVDVWLQELPPPPPDTVTPVMDAIPPDGADPVDEELTEVLTLSAGAPEGHEFRNRLADGSDGPLMVVIPCGQFVMGSPKDEEERETAEGPPHWVTIGRPIAFGKYPVTFLEYDLFARATERALPNDRGWGRGRQPVINVSWHDARAYADWLSEQTGKCYRLPTEAEWEYAARGGARSAFWWGRAVGQVHANCKGCGSPWDARSPSPVGSFGPNRFGVHDTAGNVWEWVEDCWNADYRGAPLTGAAYDTGETDRRVIRGGSYLSPASDLRSAKRSFESADARASSVGIRLVRDM